MAKGPEAVVKILGDASQLAAEMKRAGAAIDGVGAKAGDVGDKMVSAGKKMSLFVTAPIVGAMTAATYAAANLGESINKVHVIFGSGEKAVSDFAASAIKGFGLSKQSALDMAGGFGAFTKQLGNQQVSASASIELVKRAADIASLFNVSQQQAGDAIKSGLAGESEPLRRFGVLLTEAKVKNEAYAMGIAKTGTELTETQKVQARYSLILKESAVASGDYANTAAGLPNQLRTLKEETANVSAEFGKHLMPATLLGVQALRSMLHAADSLPGPAKGAALAVAGIAAAMGPVLTTAGNAARGIEGIGKAIEKLHNAEGTLTNVGKAIAGLGVVGVVVAGIMLVKTALDQIEKNHVAEKVNDINKALAGVDGHTLVGELTPAIEALDQLRLAKNRLILERSDRGPFNLVDSIFGGDPSKVLGGGAAVNAANDLALKLKIIKKAVDDLLAGGNTVGADRIIAQFKALGGETGDLERTVKNWSATQRQMNEDLEASRLKMQKVEAATMTLANTTKMFGDITKNVAGFVLTGIKAMDSSTEATAKALKVRVDQMQAEDRAASASKAIADAIRGRADQEVAAAKAVTQAQESLNAAKEKSVTLAKGVVDAEKGVADSHRNLFLATLDVRRAQEALDAAYERMPPNIDAVTKAEGDLESARKQRRSAEKGAKGAAEALVTAQKNLTDVTENAGVNAERAVTKARREVERATLDVTRKERDRVDTLNKGGATLDEMRLLDLDIADAKDRVTDAAARLVDAEQKVADVSGEVEKAAGLVTDAQDNLVDANKTLADKTDDVNTAEKTLATERLGRLPGQDVVKSKTDDLLKSQQNLAGATKEVQNKEADLAGARKAQIDGIKDIGKAEDTLKETSKANSRARKDAVDAVTAAYRAQAEYLLGAQYNKAKDIADGVTGPSAGPSKSIPASTAEQAKNKSLIMAAFRKAGYSDHQIAGVLGNVQQESGFSNTASGDKGTSIGLFQLRDPGLGSGMSVADRQDPNKNIAKILEKALRVLSPKNAPKDAAEFARAFDRLVEVSDGQARETRAQYAREFDKANTKQIQGFSGLGADFKNSFRDFSKENEDVLSTIANNGDGFDAAVAAFREAVDVFSASASMVGAVGGASSSGRIGLLSPTVTTVQDLSSPSDVPNAGSGIVRLLPSNPYATSVTVNVAGSVWQTNDLVAAVSSGLARRADQGFA